MKRITIQDIANELGVSKGTVDRAIHGRPDISLKTRNAVMSCIKKHGYEPNKIARTLSLKDKKYVIGAIFPIEPDFFWARFRDGIKAAEHELSDFGLQLKCIGSKNTSDIDSIISSMNEFIADKVSGIAVVPVDNAAVREKVTEAMSCGIPVVTANDDITGSERIFYVGPQMKQSGRIAGELIGKFLGSGGTVLTISGDIESMEYNARFEGFNEIIKEKFKNVGIIANYTFSMNTMTKNGGNIVKSILESTSGVDAIYDVDGASLYDIGCILKKSKKLKNTILVGHEISDDVRSLLKDGTVYASICQDPFSQGYNTIRLLYDYVSDGKKPEFDKLYTRLDVVLCENMDDRGDIIDSGAYYR